MINQRLKGASGNFQRSRLQGGFRIDFYDHRRATLGLGHLVERVIASGVFGLLMGLAAKTLKMEESELGKKGLIKFNISQLVCHLICWLAVAPVLDVYMMGEPWDKLLAQGLMAAVANAVTTAIVGSLLCVAYAATKTKAGSLTKE